MVVGDGTRPVGAYGSIAAKDWTGLVYAEDFSSVFSLFLSYASNGVWSLISGFWSLFSYFYSL